ncbi:uncharacterized protein F5147DRAFT_682589 [Suillus discolor]|uniref:Uncharacterized protein n=1 Tax=Suillus discolor TaxID=1912936 RepID=A0A9P7FDF2_9AGAM|nr:uncharacterized protein F5147DRAFT_682589 [Suillus discolor]KAG2113069.1 hypothetical protein F5147DRAFT_682589 [Suillus discolor]
MCRRRVFLLSSMSACDIIVTANVTLRRGTSHSCGLAICHNQCIILLGSIVLKRAPVTPHQWTILPLTRQADVSKRKVHSIPPCRRSIDLLDLEFIGCVVQLEIGYTCLANK